MKKLGFISSALRISTRPDTEVIGPRTRILGLFKGFEAQGWEIKSFIVGDRVAQKLLAKAPEKATNGKFIPTLIADLVRLFLSRINTQKSWKEIGNQIDWVIEFAATLQSIGWKFKQYGIPWIVHTEGILFKESKAERKSIVLGSIAKEIEMRTYRECDALVCVSETLKQLIVFEAHVPPEKIVVVPNGVDTDLFDPVQYQPLRFFPGFTVGFVGGLYLWQAVDLLIEAIHDLRADGMDLSVVVVGDGIMYETWQNHANHLGISSNVKFVGRVLWAEVPKYIKGFDVCYTGQVEVQQVGKMYHSPLKLYEYMAMAKPVIASAFEDATRIIDDRQTGFLFKPGDKQDLKRVLTMAHQLQDQLSVMGEQARKRVIETHSWEARVKKMIDELEHILKID